MQPPACRLLDPPNSPPIDPFLADRLRNHRHLAIAPPASALKNQALTLFLIFGVIILPLVDNVMYVVLETGGKQYRVSAGDTLEIERVAVEAGQPFTFDRVLLVNNDGRVTIGAPTVAQASVVADVLEHRRGPKKIAFKMKRRKGYHKTIGHRQELTVVRIKEIKS